jgi:hypothetical protein
VAEATIQSCLYLGGNARFILQAAGQTGQTVIPLEVVTGTTHLEQFSEGQRVTLHFPPDKIWLTAPEQPN